MIFRAIGNKEFISIEDSASKLIHYIAKEHGGKVFALGGLSIGAQIVCEVLSQQSNIADYAIVENTSAKVLIIVGEKELSIMKQSAQLLHQTISGSVLYTAPKMKHGELSIVHKEKYIQLIRGFLAK